MHNRIPLLLLMLLALTACGAAATPTPTPTLTPIPAPTATATFAVPTDVLGEIARTVTVPTPGTLEANAMSMTNEPEVPLTFGQVVFTQSGGPASIQSMVSLQADGTLMREGVLVGTVSPERVEEVRAALDAIRFFSINGIFTGGSTRTDAYSYSLRVDGDEGSKTLYAQDGLTPPELISVFTLLRNLQPEGAMEVTAEATAAS